MDGILIAFDFIWKVLLSDRNFATLLDQPLDIGDILNTVCRSILFSYSTLFLYTKTNHNMIKNFVKKRLCGNDVF